MTNRLQALSAAVAGRGRSWSEVAGRMTTVAADFEADATPSVPALTARGVTKSFGHAWA